MNFGSWTIRDLTGWPGPEGCDGVVLLSGGGPQVRGVLGLFRLGGEHGGIHPGHGPPQWRVKMINANKYMYDPWTNIYIWHFTSTSTDARVPFTTETENAQGKGSFTVQTMHKGARAYYWNMPLCIIILQTTNKTGKKLSNKPCHYFFFNNYPNL